MNEHITRVSLDAALDGDRTDWARLAGLSDVALDAAIASDADTFALSEDAAGGLRWLVYKETSGTWRWRLTDRAGKAVAESPKSYRHRSEVDSAINSLREALKAA